MPTLADGGAAAGILSATVLIGGVLFTQVRKRRTTGRVRRARDEVVFGTPEIMDERTGKVIQPERLGLGERMDEMDGWRGTVTADLAGIKAQLTTVIRYLRPNGGHTDNPGDVVKRSETKLDRQDRWIKQIAEASGVELDE